ncbi:molybdenum cofactor guanylyltransferase [Sphingomonas sp. MMS12-HWE2-04]|uniref:molybdenum cofactor guanylyltransferase n=1 Tax=Sphingomonas sp. MMS12-HWE2-04 TaxID=3234199 RepID=UPI00384C48D2
MKTLGAVLAGGQSTRFGSDKAEALLDGKPLLAHAIETLRPHCDVLVIVGRIHARSETIADWPAPDMGPLAAIAGALRHAAAHGFDQMLSAPVDCVALPANLRALLDPAPAFLIDQPVIGLWPTAATPDAEAILSGTGRHSVRAFAERIGARPIAAQLPPNINTPADLARLREVPRN